MFIDKTDDPTLYVRVISVRDVDNGAMDSERVIAIEMEVAGKGRFVAYGIDLSDGDYVVTSDSPVPSAAMRKASETTELWLRGIVAIPFPAGMGGDH